MYMMSYGSPAEGVSDYSETAYRRMLQKADVRIGEAFCWDTDYPEVRKGAVVYPDQLRLDWDPQVAAVEGIIIELSKERQVQRIVE
jgi:hypothetical protein